MEKGKETILLINEAISKITSDVIFHPEKYIWSRISPGRWRTPEIVTSRFEIKAKREKLSGFVEVHGAIWSGMNAIFSRSK